MSTGFRLPPRIHNRAAFFTNVLVIPHPCFGIDRFADSAENAERRKVVFVWPFVSEPDESTNCRWCGVKRIHFELLDDFPEPSGVGKCGHAFKHQCRCAIAEWAVNHIAMPCD